MDEFAGSFNPGSVAATVVVGILVGGLVIRPLAVLPAHVIQLMGIAVTTFLAMMVARDAIQGGAPWAGELGDLVLWFLYTLAMAAGRRIPLERIPATRMLAGRGAAGSRDEEQP